MTPFYSNINNMVNNLFKIKMMIDNMRKSNIFISLGVILLCTMCLCKEHGAFEMFAAKKSAVAANTSMMNVAYVISDSKCLPDPNLVTHIYYAFAEVKPDFTGVDIINPERFQQIVDLKKENPNLKVSLSVGGYRKEGFSEVCASKKNRKAFVADLKRIVKKYKLDGIDLDWEFPTTTDGGHTARPDDDINYGLLVKELRKALGKNKLITYYSNNSGNFIDHKVMLPYVDYVMVSGYNLGMPPKHQSNLYTSDLFPGWSVEKAVTVHHRKGVPYEKMLLGIPFFARSVPVKMKSGKKSNYFEYTSFPENLASFEKHWDDTAKAPYMTDSAGNVVATYDTPHSIAIKADFVRSHGLSGGFYWNYCGDDSTHQLARTMHQYFMK